MNKVIILTVAFVASALALGEDHLWLMSTFNSFISEHNKHYATKDEFSYRMRVFEKNLRAIKALNANDNDTAIYGLNFFADMSTEEFQKYPCGGNLANLKAPEGFTEQEIAVVPDYFAPPPESFDWTTKGAVTAVKNQGMCGSCWAFSTIVNIEGVWNLAGNKLVRLSENELVDCTKTSFGCQGGWPQWALSDILKAPFNGKMITEDSWPYEGSDQPCTWDQQGRVVGATIKAYKSYCTLDTAACTEEDMAQLVVDKGPLSVCLDATPMQFYTGGIADPQCNPNLINHCVAIVGYGSENGVAYWKIKNSWGTSWGEQGFYRLIRGKGACGINKVINVAEV